MLSGIETTKEKVLRIILAGQPELNEKLNSQDLVQLTQRVRLRFHLAALTEAETTAYIDHRLEVAGSQGRHIFAQDTYPRIYKYTGGVPRLINTLCDTCMMSAFGRDSDTVAMEDLDAAIRRIAVGRVRCRHEPHADAQHGSVAHPAPHAAAGTSGRPHTARTGGKTVLERELKPGRLVIGRTSDNDLQIDSKFISRHHCQIVTQPDSCLIEDLNSTNGIYVKSKRVRRHNLNDGDVVHVGQHEIMYIDERAPRVRTAVDPVGSETPDKD